MGKVTFKYNEVNQEYFNENYNLVMTTLFNENDQTILIDDKNDRCRFCGRTKKEVKFSNKCHAIPEFLGNKKVITRNECDNCNHKYANILEDNLAKYTLPTRLITRVSGKNGVPQYKNIHNKSRMKFENIFRIVDNGELTKIDRKRKQFELKFNIQPFTPIKVYKALVRIALNCLPKVYFDKFTLIDWLENDQDLGSLTNFYTTIINQYFTIMPPSCNLCLLIRKNDKENVPYCQMILQFNNNYIQVIIPFLNEDKCLEKTEEVVIYPFYIFDKKQDNIKVKLIRLSSRNKENINQIFSGSFTDMICKKF